MKSMPIPDKLMFEDMKRETIGAPPGMEADCRPVEVLRGRSEKLNSAVSLVFIQVNDEDVRLLADNGGFWLAFFGQFIVPFDVQHLGGETTDE